ncbi:inorganic phosphate transporter, partial [Dolichospermum sp. ST_sed3]|nr:inorganic phosphate transporter [Dolichospermum sp. ST_sed3]
MEFLYFVIGLVLVFDFINGFHDSANSIATIVSTKVLSPLTAVVWAAFFNFIDFLIFNLKVATTIGKGVVNPDVINLNVVAAALFAAITWNLLTWWWGLPSSSSHTLVGGLVGAAVM